MMMEMVVFDDFDDLMVYVHSCGLDLFAFLIKSSHFFVLFYCLFLFTTDRCWTEVSTSKSLLVATLICK